MPQTSNKAYKFAPAETGEKRLDLSLDGDGAVIQLSSWVDGLGWCGEKTMQLDAEMLDEMHRILGAARVRLRQQKTDDGDAAVASKVLSFPG